MKRMVCRTHRAAWKPVAGAVMLGLLAVGCGDNESNPEAVTVEKLKYPGGLSILDKGNGKATLTWSGANNEKDFDGYNVYGMINNPALGVTHGVPLQLLDDKGEPVQAARDVLAKFNYSPDTKLNQKADALNNEEGKAEFSALPIHTGAADARMLPTCKPVAGACKLTDANTKGKTAADPTYAANGQVTFEVPDQMSVGSEYCFLVLSSMDGGKKVSQTSSNAACFVPKYKAEFNLPLVDAAANNKSFDLTAWLATCTDTGCSDPTAATATVIAASPGSATAASTLPLYLENGPAFVTGKNTAIIDLGFYAGGFDDPTLDHKAPELKLDPNGVYNEGGYALSGQSVPVAKQHMYVIAVGDPNATTTPTEFHYHWIYVKGDVVAGQTVPVEMRLSKNKNAR